MVSDLQKASQSRVFVVEDGAAPNHCPEYEILARAGAITWGQGAVTPVRVADPQSYGRFITIDKIRGQPDLPGITIETRMTRDLSRWFALVRKACPLDLHINIGSCKDPQDHDLGFEKMLVIENAVITNYSTSELGAFDFDQENPTMETLELMGDDLYEVGPMAFGEFAATAVYDEVMGITICDSRTCGECGIPSDGCQRVFMASKGNVASPGLAPGVVWSQDGGATVATILITTMPVNQAPSDIACVGPLLAVPSNAGDAVHVTAIADILDGTQAWTAITAGIDAAGSPNRIASTSRTNTWMTGDGGYIYHTTDILTGFTVQSSGGVTSQNLGPIHALDDQNVLVGGASNAILVTVNGGSVWSLIAGPAAKAGVTITAVSMRSPTVWLIAYIDGSLYYTINSGVTWVAKALPGGLTRIDDMSFSTPTVGFISGRVGTSARLLRTVSGGCSWYVLPEELGTVPTAAAYNRLATCGENANLVYAGGLRVAGGDGIATKGAG